MLSREELQRLKAAFDIVGNDPTLDLAVSQAFRAAPTDLTVLVIGESGVGKEAMPRLIHQNSLRKHAKYFAVNCGAIPEGTVDSELFGHEKGSFTGATERRKGYFEEADGGTLFLDEVAELPLPSQAKLLRVLQSGEFIRVGSSQVLKCDVRVIAATNVDLLTAVRQGKFRADLYYRLNSVLVFVPPLRDRGTDIQLLFRKFLSDFAEKYKTSRVSLTPEASQMLSAYRWPGNIRELKNVAERLAAFESVPDGRARVEITPQTMAEYIPKDMGQLLPVQSGQDAKGDFTSSDKDMVFRILYQLKADVDMLKKAVFQSGTDEQYPVRALSEPHNDTAIVTPHNPSRVDIPVEDQGLAEEPGTAAHEEEDLNLERMGEEAIRAALARHGGRRRPAAKELGISERTLFRKMNKFNIK